MRPSLLNVLGFGASSQKNTLSGSVVIDRSAQALYDLWRKPETLPLLMGHFASITILNQTDSLWRINTPLGALLEWRARIVEEKRGEVLQWRSLEGALVPNEGHLSFRPAPTGKGTEVTLLIHFTPPGGLIGRKLGHLFTLFSNDMLQKTLEKFTTMALTQTEGEP